MPPHSTPPPANAGWRTPTTRPHPLRGAPTAAPAPRAAFPPAILTSPAPPATLLSLHTRQILSRTSLSGYPQALPIPQPGAPTYLSAIGSPPATIFSATRPQRPRAAGPPAGAGAGAGPGPPCVGAAVPSRGEVISATSAAADGRARRRCLGGPLTAVGCMGTQGRKGGGGGHGAYPGEGLPPPPEHPPGQILPEEKPGKEPLPSAGTCVTRAPSPASAWAVSFLPAALGQGEVLARCVLRGMADREGDCPLWPGKCSHLSVRKWLHIQWELSLRSRKCVCGNQGDKVCREVVFLIKPNDLKEMEKLLGAYTVPPNSVGLPLCHVWGTEWKRETGKQRYLPVQSRPWETRKAIGKRHLAAGAFVWWRAVSWVRRQLSRHVSFPLKNTTG